MGINTWNFPCWAAQDNGPDSPPRQQTGLLYEVGPGALISGTQPFTQEITSIFSFFIRPRWTSQDDDRQGLFSIGEGGAEALGYRFMDSGSSPAMQAIFNDNDTATPRYNFRIGDEDGVSWLQDSKWYQFAISSGAGGFSYACNGTDSPHATVTTNTPGLLNLNNGVERIWMIGPTAATGSSPLATSVQWPTVVFGPAAHYTGQIDLTDSVVRARIFDTDGNLKNPGENGSLWFGDVYGDVVPEYYFPNGVPIHQKGSDTEVWNHRAGGAAVSSTPPGGLRKQYENAPVPVYDPRMMTFDGATGYYDKTLTTTGNAFTVTAQFNLASFSGGGSQYLMRMRSGSRILMSVIAFANDHATTSYRDKIAVLCQDATVNICLLLSDTTLIDGADHTVFFSYDGTAGAATFYADGVDADDTGEGTRVLTTGTLPVGAGNILYVGSLAGASNFWDGDIGYVGYREAYLTNPTDFTSVSGPLELDETTWTEWGAQPLFWNDEGIMSVQNLGSAGLMTLNGTITGPS